MGSDYKDSVKTDDLFVYISVYILSIVPCALW